MAIKKDAKNRNPMDEFINSATNNGEGKEDSLINVDSKQTQSQSILDVDSKQMQSQSILDAEQSQNQTVNSSILTSADDCTSFTTPLNLYELCALRFMADRDDRSMRKMGRRLWAKLIVSEAENHGFNSVVAAEYIGEKEREYSNQFDKN